MSDVSADSIKTIVRYAHSTNPPGVLCALAHAESSCTFEEFETEIRNARRSDEATGFDRTGFTLVKHATKVTDFEDARQIDEIYVPEIQKLVKGMTGASRVIVFHKVGRYEGGEEVGKRQPAGNAHIDYDRVSFETWARQELGADEADPLLRGRWAAVNVWRGLRPVERRPLAIIDGRTVPDSSLLTVPIHERPGEETPFAGLNVKYDPALKWYYYPDMQVDEALVFTLFDTDPSQPQRVAHSAINDPTSRPDAAPRASFEVRTMAFFD